MHPLTTFPALLTFGLIAPLLLRLAVSLYMLLVAHLKFKTQKIGSIIFAIPGLLLLIGFHTQIASLFSIIVLSIDAYTNKKRAGLALEQKMIFAFVVIILLSLLFTGPGFFALDLPL